MRSSASTPVLLHATLITLLPAPCLAQSDNSNPIQIASATWLGNVTSSNTAWGRDLGFQGNIGSCYINSFGDDFKCKSENPQLGCYFVITSRNSCGQPINETSYKDYFLKDNGTPAPCAHWISPENVTTPMGITNVVQTGDNTGILYVLPGNPSKTQADAGWQGAGIAVVTTDDNCGITVNRPSRNLWNGNLAGTGIGSQPFNESFFGDHGALLAEDGYIYTYGKIPLHLGITVARSKPEAATTLEGYEYWNGTAFQTDRIQNPKPIVSILNHTGQGSILWNPMYKRYIYLSTDFSVVDARTAVNPWGPWSQPKDVWSLKQMPYRETPAKNSLEIFYSPAYQPKWSSTNGSDFVLWVTYSVDKSSVDGGGHQIGTAVRVNLVGGNATSSSDGGAGGNGGVGTAVNTGLLTLVSLMLLALGLGMSLSL